ncbi:alginate lyase [Streptomyces avermitilis]|uniref:Secreted protein n=2 Tax=Streptomyces avermitilis TaxID=33903 RepID=Q827M6_STRAW|nr:MULTISPECIES: alginate lyase family protein [Streptomyces]KUN53947.1 alginate lyase [Streptomyces avermitilis]MYT02438.1 alginate lyase [Streptomyces sp. SID5469]OOV27490.1 alginate lyase [Streptomyces avermitilis]BAC74609.1 putative secreted protein [Streptomyces avermitilis MA-4680 = NBRC 14893]BBJ55191.1 alginate lyase [Streptomyces avermitilis]
MSARPRLAVLLAAAATLAAVVVPSASAHTPPKAPRTAVLDGTRLQQTRLRLDRGDPRLRRTLEDLTARADNWLNQGPWTVVDKPKPAPGGDVHDYLSQAPYWWPSQPKSADNPWGCPYVQRDGQRNPEVDTGTDRQDVEKVFDSAYDLSLAWYYTGRKQYAEKAATVLRTWFLAPATRMNPHLNHGQFIPCKYDGRAIGIIDFSQSYTSVLDALAILDTGAPGWSRADRTAMRAWNVDYRDWLVNSAFGAEEGAAKNNHGTFYDMQLAALAYATGDTDLARRTVLGARAGRIAPQIAADGSQPQELTRTRSWHYSTFDLVAYTRLAAIGRHVGVDLWAYEGPDGQSLFKAVDYLLPAATGAAPWPHPELEFHRFAASDVVHAAADAGDRAARAAVPKLEAPPGGDLWALRPAAEQLDSIAG